MINVTDETFQRDVLGAERPAIVDFWAPWCGPCEAVEKVLGELEREAAGRVIFARLDVDQNPTTASRFGVLALPTAVVFANGDAQSTVVGARPRSYYEREWAAWLSEGRSTSRPA